MVEARKVEEMCMEHPKGHGPDYAEEWEKFREFHTLCKTIDKGTFDSYPENVQRKIIENITRIANQGIPMTPNLATRAWRDRQAARARLA